MKWPIISLGDLCSLHNGKAFKESDWSNTGQPIIRIQNLNSRGGAFNYWAGSLAGQVIVKPKDLLLAWSGTPGTSFGAHIWTGAEGVLNQHIFRVDLDLERIDPSWALRAINQQLNRLIALAHGGVGLKHVTRGTVENLQIPLPTLNEQRRIAAILDQAEALRAKRRQALAKLDTLTHSLFLEMFGDPESNPRGWAKKKLVDICSIITDGEHQTPKRSAAGFKLLSARNVRNGYLDFSDVDYVDEAEFTRIVSRCRPRRKDILISCSGTIGRVSAIRTDDGLCLVRSAALLRPLEDIVDTDFLESWLLQPMMTRTMMSRANASGQPNLFQNQIKELPVLVPPLSSQREFTVRADKIREAKTKSLTGANSVNRLTSSLQHRAFRGEL